MSTTFDSWINLSRKIIFILTDVI